MFELLSQHGQRTILLCNSCNNNTTMVMAVHIYLPNNNSSELLKKGVEYKAIFFKKPVLWSLSDALTCFRTSDILFRSRLVEFMNANAETFLSLSFTDYADNTCSFINQICLISNTLKQLTETHVVKIEKYDAVCQKWYSESLGMSRKSHLHHKSFFRINRSETPHLKAIDSLSGKAALVNLPCHMCLCIW